MKLTIAVALMVAATPLLAQQPDLSGHWTFNAAQSDNPRDMLQGRDSTGDQSRGGRGGGYAGLGGGGGKVTEDYLRSQDGKQLYVIVKFEGGRGRSIEFRRVYDGAAAK